MRKALVGVAAVVMAIGCGSGEPPAPEVPPPTAPPADATPPAAPSNGRCAGLVFTETWQGEYPGPPVDVKSAVTVPARAEPCDVATSVSCNVPAGLYHPWSKVSTAEFGTIRSIDTWRALRGGTVPIEDGPVAVAAGELVQVTTYWGEGHCTVVVGGKPGPSMCPDMLDDEAGSLFEQVPGPEVAEIQLFAVTCADGTKAWVDADAAFFERPEVYEGQTPGYGEVLPAAP